VDPDSDPQHCYKAVRTRPTCTAKGLKAVPEVEATWKRKKTRKKRRKVIACTCMIFSIYIHFLPPIKGSLKLLL
jgi:hypothetical protein